jgi:hypothetical protein
MSRRDSGPPGEAAPRTARHHHQSLNKDQHPKPNATPRHTGRYAHAWRQGFCYGAALDALRPAARPTDDPEVWVILSRLAEEDTLAGGDD